MLPRSLGNNGHSLDLCAILPHSLHFVLVFPALVALALAFEPFDDGWLAFAAFAALAFFSSFFFPFLPVCFALPESDVAGGVGEGAGAGRASIGAGAFGATAACGGLLFTCFIWF